MRTFFKQVKWPPTQYTLATSQSQIKWQRCFFGTFPVTSFIRQLRMQKNSSLLYGILLP